MNGEIRTTFPRWWSSADHHDRAAAKTKSGERKGDGSATIY
jgi:hypothetical protein